MQASKLIVANMHFISAIYTWLFSLIAEFLFFSLEWHVLIYWNGYNKPVVSRELCARDMHTQT